MPITIDKPSKYFDTKLYTGNGSTQTVSGLSFAPDWLWIKGRSGVRNHSLFDIVRGNDKRLISNSTGAETTETALTSFNSDGFTLDSGTTANANGETFVSWCWDANGAGVSNTAGTISSTVSANTTSGFSIVSYTGNFTSGATIGHGLGVTPKVIIIKNRGSAVNWTSYHSTIGNTAGLHLNTAGGSDVNSGFFNNTSPSSTVFTVGDGSTVNSASTAYIAYCFAEVKGYSKFGSYTGNGSTDGTFIYTGFKPAFVMWKCTDDIGENWCILDSKRDTYNLSYRRLNAETSAVEATSTGSANSIFDMLSNGFKHRGSGTVSNGSGNNYIYMAFAENPFVSSKGIPTTAR